MELDLDLNIEEAKNRQSLEKKIKIIKNYLVITPKAIANLDHQLIFNLPPIKISKLIELINVEFMKKRFNDQSKIKINNYN